MTEPLMLILGVLAHFFKALAQIRVNGHPINPIKYWLDHPYHSALTVIGAIVGYVALMETGQLTAINAFGIGFMANSVADVIGSRSTKVL